MRDETEMPTTTASPTTSPTTRTPQQDAVHFITREYGQTACGDRTCPDCYEQPETATEAEQQPRARAYRQDGHSIEDHPVDDREIRTIALPRAPFDHDDTIAALAILHKAVRDAAPGPAAAWNIVSHAETRLNRELDEYYRGARA